MVQFAELFQDLKIVSPLATQLSWSHFIEILPLESQEARLFYAHDAATRHLGRMELRRQISRKAFPPKEDFERKIKEILIEAKERLERRRLFPTGKTQKQLDYFYDSKDDDLETG